SNYIEDGIYSFDIYFNKDYLESSEIRVKDQNLCFNRHNLETLPINDSSFSQYESILFDNDGCHTITDIPFVFVSTDIAKGRVDIVVPQEHLAREYRLGFVDPKLWDDGIAGVFADYHLNYYASKTNNSDWSDSFITYGLLGANIGSVRLRSRYQYLEETNSAELTSYYAYIPLRSLGAKLSVGNLQSKSNIYPSLRMDGMTLENDDTMVPDYLRGYSPVVSGTVEQDSVITLSQDGRILKVVNVNAGTYLIDDIPQTSIGQIEVEIKGADGSIESFSVSDASVMFLTRPKTWRYNFSLGRPDKDYADYNNAFAIGEASYGLNNHLSLFSGTLLDQDYQAYSIGFGVNLYQFGAFSFDATQSRAKVNHGDERGQSYGIAYNQQLNQQGLGIRVAGYRYSDEDYWDYSDYVKSHDDTDYTYRLNNNRKGLTTLTLTQRLAAASVFFSYQNEEHWSSESLSQRYDLSVTQPITFRGVTLYLNANAYTTKNQQYTYSYQQGVTLERYDNRGVSIGFSLPLGNSDTVAFNYRNNDGKYNQTIAYSGNDSAEYESYRVAMDVHEGEALGVSGSYNKEYPYWNVALAGGYQTNNTSYFSGSASGSAVLTQHGPAYSSQTYGDTKLLIDTVVPNVTIEGTGKERSNHFGLALVNSVQPYQMSRNTIDYKHLPDDIEVLDTIDRVVLTEGAIGFTRIRARVGQNFLARLYSEQTIPFGSSINDSVTQDEVGIVGNEQLVYVSGINEDSILHVIVGNQPICQLAITETTLLDQTPIRDIECIVSTD
ncbi:fimbria/pilus outer membrane usher protein, partial [Vibrio sp. FNV 38]|nr:fimbria/pilus outer membrane usher protein [Vibrio sp. FNV 38]